MCASNFFVCVVQRNTLADQLNEYRKNGEYTDVKLQLGDKLFPANRNILAFSSPVLKALISDQWSTTNICQLSEEYVDVEIMEDLLSFFYTGRITLTPDNVHPICMAAHFLQTPELLKASVKYLCQLITVENVLTLLKFSNTCELEELNYSCFRFVNNNYESVFQSSYVLELSFKNFKDLIAGLKKFWAKKIRENTFECIVRWTERNLSERLNQLPVLLKNIPLEELPLKFLTETVSTHPLVKDSKPCMETVSDALANYQTYSNLALKISQNIVVFGRKDRRSSNDSFQSMSYLDFRTGVWKYLPEIPTYRSKYVVTVINQQDIIVCGGENQRKRELDPVWMFEWISQTWTKLPRMPVACPDVSIAACNGDLYVIGSFDYLFEQSLYSSSVLRYSFETKQWTLVNSMYRERCGGQLIEYKKHLYALEGDFKNTVERYDSLQDKWTLIWETPKEHDIVAATLHEGKIYCYGYEKFGVYDIEKNIWSSLPVPPLLEDSSFVSINGKLVLSGSSPDYRQSYMTYEFDILNQKWLNSRRLNADLAHYYKAVVGPFY